MVNMSNKDFWNERAKNIKSNSDTCNDMYRRYIETNLIKNILKIKFPENDMGLEIGCGSGYGTIVYSDFFKYLTAIDQAEKMIEKAKLINNRSNIKYMQKDIFDLEKRGIYDVVISQRCLINLESWEKQKEAINLIREVLKTNGAFIMIESISEGRDNLNKERITKGLSKMDTPWFNVEFKKDELLEYLKSKGFIINIINSALGYYDYLVKVTYPYIIYPTQPKFNSIYCLMVYEDIIDKEIFDNLINLNKDKDSIINLFNEYINFNKTICIVAIKKEI